jgi:hypothetical protein
MTLPDVLKPSSPQDVKVRHVNVRQHSETRVVQGRIASLSSVIDMGIEPDARDY